MKISVVDDEVIAAKYLKKLIESKIPDAEVDIFTEALKAFNNLIVNPCDILFLDIKMPQLNGIYFAEQILNVYPEMKICFVTAYDEYAVRAFEINASDYILKPYTEERLEKCINRLDLENKSKMEIKNLSYDLSYDLDIICALKDDEYVLLKYDDIYYFETENRKVLIHTKFGVYMGNKNLNFYEEKLKKHAFFRIHKCYIVNLTKVDKFYPKINYSYEMAFDDIADKVPLSRNKVKALKVYFDL